jgi:hypothetical protein
MKAVKALTLKLRGRHNLSSARGNERARAIILCGASVCGCISAVCIANSITQPRMRFTERERVCTRHPHCGAHRLRKIHFPSHVRRLASSILLRRLLGDNAIDFAALF